MGIDPFAALGVMDDAGPPVAATTDSDGIPTMSVSPSRKGGIDPFTALGVDSNENFDPTPASPNVASPPSTGRGVAKNAAAGLVEGSQGVGNMILDPVGNFVGKPLATAAVFAHDALAPVFGGQRFPDDVRNMLLGDNVPQPVTRATDAAASAMGVPTPDEVPANGPSERYARAGVAGAVRTAALAPGASVITPLTGVGMGVSGQAGADAAPEWAKPMAGMAGGFAGGIGIPAGASAGRMVGGAIARKSGTDLNIGRRQDIGDIRPTNAQAQQTGEQLSEAIGPIGRQNITRSLADEKTAQDLESQLEKYNLHPLEREQIEEQLEPLRATRSVMVPGSEPTTAELANTAGAQDLEQATKKVNAPAFVERNTQRNNARVGAIENAADAPDSVPSPPVAQGNPQTLGQVVTDRLRQIEADGQQNVASAKAGVQSNPLQDAGTDHVSSIGERLRKSLVAARDPWIKAYREAWKRVDPEGTWAISAQPLRDRISELQGTISPSSSINPALTKIIDRALAIPGRAVRFSDLAQMRADANDFTRKNGAAMSDNEGRIASTIKGAIDETIAASIDEKAKVDPDLQSRLEALRDEHQQSGEAASNGAGGTTTASGENMALRAGADGSGGEPEGGRGVASGSSGVSDGATAGAGNADNEPPARPASLADGVTPQPPAIQPNMTQEHVDTFAEANAATKAKKERFDQGGVGAALQRGSNFEPFRVQDGNVPRQIFTGNNVEPAEVDRFITAVGKDKAQEIGRDVLVNDLRSKNILNPDGDVNETKLGRWLSARSATLERFQELKKQFGDLKSAQATVNEAMAKGVADRKAFQDSVAGRIIGADPRNAVQKILSGANPEANMRQLVDQIKDNPDAVASLKRMVTDYITEKHSSATPSTDGFDMLKADGLRRFIKQYKEPLRVLFGGQGLQNLEMIGADLRRQAGGPNALAGSQTAAHGARSARTGIGHDDHGANTTLLALLGEHLGSTMHGIGGIVGTGIGIVGGTMLNSMKQAAIRNKNDLTSFAMLHPEVAKALMEKADAKNAMSLAAKKRIGAAMRTAIMADMGSDGEQKK